MNALKATWTVTAGILIDKPIDEYSKRYTYTSKMQSEDRDGKYTPGHFDRIKDEAHDYARSLTDPRLLNWVDITFIWY